MKTEVCDHGNIHVDDRPCRDCLVLKPKKHPIAHAGIEFDEPKRARLTDPSTSHEAAATATNYDDAILQAYAQHGPGTEEEVSKWTGIPRPSISPCFKPLERRGLIVKILRPDGTVLKRKNDSGKSAIVRGLQEQQTRHVAQQMPDLEEGQAA
jgi:hypothetical protein